MQSTHTSISRDFVHLHVHSHYSTLDGIVTPQNLVSKAKKLGFSSLALTDHGNLFGAIQFYQAAKEAGIKPIMGMEAYITYDEPNSEQKIRDNYHMILLAQNLTGWKNLIKLASRAALKNFYYVPRINLFELLENNEGLIATTACIAGIAGKKGRVNHKKVVVGGVYDEESKTFSDPEGHIERRLRLVKEAFPNRFYIEVQPHMFWEQQVFNEWAVAMARNTLDLPLVLTTDIHYLEKEDIKAARMVVAQQRKITVQEIELVEEQRHGAGQYYLKDKATMWSVAHQQNFIDAAENTVKIADECNVEITLGEYQMPVLDITDNPDYPVFKTWQETLLEEASVPSLIASLI